MNTPIIITLIICATIVVIVGLRIHAAKKAVEDLKNLIDDDIL